MRRVVALMLCMLLAVAVMVSCSAENEPAQQGAGGHPEEADDTTRMEAAEQDTMMEDSMMMEDEMEMEGEDDGE